MASKVNISALEEYSKLYASNLCDSFFNRNERITGKQILNLSNVQQVNLFAIKNLYERWKTDAEKFRSPYFNFEHEDVKKVLNSFMNTVSQHILVNRTDFEPILEKAVRETLLLVFYPEEYFNEAVRDLPNFTLTKDAVSQIGKFTQINKSVTVALDDRLNGQNYVYATEALHWLEDIYENITFEATEKYVAIFSEKVPLDSTKFTKQGKGFEFLPLQPVEVQDDKKPALEEVSFFDREMPQMIAEKPVAVEIPKMTLLAEKPVKVVEEEPADLRLNDRFKTEKSINDNTKTTSTISDAHQTAAIEGIRSGISLNQRFLFINQLFNAEVDIYNHAIDELELCKDFDEAKELVIRKYVNRYNWDLTNFDAEEFFDILRRRFS